MTPKKILHIANRADRLLGRRYYALQNKIQNGFVRNGHNVYWFSDRDIAKTSSIIPARSFGAGACNRKLLEVCRNFRPDVIALSHADIITLETLKEVREILKDVRIFQYNIDGLYTPSNVKSILSRVDVVDYTFMTTAGSALKTVGTETAPACFFPTPVDTSIDIHCNWMKQKFDYDLFFVARYGDWMDPESMRAQAFKYLPEDPPDLRVFMSDSVWGEDFMNAAAASKIGINFNQKPPGEVVGDGGNLYMCSSDRVSLCLGNGLLTFSDSTFMLSELYGSDAIIDVSTYDEFREKVLYFMKNDSERVNIAKKGYEFVHNEHNERCITAYMLETVMGDNYSRTYMWPTEQYS